MPTSLCRPRGAGPARAKQDGGTVPVPLHAPWGGLEMQHGGQHAPREQRPARSVRHGLQRRSCGTCSVHHPCRNTNASRACLVTALTSICRQGLAAPAFTTPAIFIGDLQKTSASSPRSFTLALHPPKGSVPQISVLARLRTWQPAQVNHSPLWSCRLVPPVSRGTLYGVPAVHHLLINAFWHPLYLQV